mmetsp:Transcript_14537/g.25367  ORF Transcript_14537/g.25367 Transcript_14537/m.25367 type:complete len:311 (+) Transcript_14537:128-1060(+)
MGRQSGEASSSEGLHQRTGYTAFRTGQAAYPQQSHQQTQDQHSRHTSGQLPASMQELSRTSCVVIPSHLALWALTFGPLIVWFLSVVLGMHAFQGLHHKHGRVDHLMMWFDAGVFRTLAGPLLPFISILLRAISMARLPESLQQQMQGSRPGTWSFAAHCPATLLLRAAAVYLMIILTRMVLYTGHVAVTRSHGVDSRAYLSDHVLLGASVMACLQVEVACAVSDLVKLEYLVAPIWRGMVAAVGMMLSLMLLMFVALDMHFTARHFHMPSETAVSLAAGFLLFQAPILAWVGFQAQKGRVKCRLAAGAQ